MKIKILFGVISISLFVFSSCTQSEPPELVPDWADVTFTATGMGAQPNDAENKAQARLMACNAAKMDAYRQLEEQIHGIKIDAETYVKNYITRNDEIMAKTEGFIKSARVIDTKENPDGSCEVTLQLHLGKSFADIVLKGK